MTIAQKIFFPNIGAGEGASSKGGALGHNFCTHWPLAFDLWRNAI